MTWPHCRHCNQSWDSMCQDHTDPVLCDPVDAEEPMSNPATQATPATSDIPTYEQQVRELLAMFKHDDASTFSLSTATVTALFAEWDAERAAYHQLRECAERIAQDASLSSHTRGSTGRERRLMWVEEPDIDALRAALHPACDPTDAGSGDVAGEAQDA